MTLPNTPALPAAPVQPLSGAPLPPEQGGPDSSEGEPTGQATPAPQTVTLEQLQQLLDQQARHFQSQMDKREARLARQLNGQTLPSRTAQALDQLGMKLPDGKKPDDLVAALQAHGLLPVDESDEDLANGPEPSAPDPVTQAGQMLASQYGLAAGDPELQLIRAQGVTPEQYLQSIMQAGLAKQQRLAQTQNLAARLPGLVNGGQAPPTNPIEKIMSTDELYELAARQARQGSRGR